MPLKCPASILEAPPMLYVAVTESFLPVFLIVFTVLAFFFLLVVFCFDPTRDGDVGGPMNRNMPDSMRQDTPSVCYLELPEAPRHLSYWGISPEVICDFVVTKAGKATKVNMVRATHVEMVRPCIEAIKRGRFMPARNADGEPIACPMRLPIVIQARPQVPVRQPGQQRTDIYTIPRAS